MRAIAAIFITVCIVRCCAVEGDSLSIRDSLFEPLHCHGALSGLRLIEPFRTITRQECSTVPYRTFDDVLEWRMPVYIFSSGSLGDFNMPVLLGSKPRDQNVVYDGISVASYSVGMLPPTLIMPEFIERVGVLVGADAAIVAGSVGSALWVQQPWYNTRMPYTRLWYCQSAYDYIAADGVFSQNIAPNLNMTWGFRRAGWLGRYTNQWLDAWNTRVLVRWNASERSNISLVHRFTNWGIGTNGGINTALSDDPNNERTAIVVYSNLDQRLFRHELQVCASDSSRTLVLYATLGFRHEEWNLYRAPTLAVSNDSSKHVRWIEHALSSALRAERTLTSDVSVMAGVEAALARGTSAEYVMPSILTRVHQYAYMRWTPHDNIVRGRAGYRLVFDGGSFYPIVGGVLEVAMHDVRIGVDLSSALRFPSWMEIGARPERIHGVLGTLRYNDSLFAAELVAYVRYRVNPIVVVPILRGDTIISTTVASGSSGQWERGTTVECRLQFGRAIITPRLLLSFDGAQRLPLAYGVLSVQYMHRIGRSILRGELFLRARTAVHAERLIPQTWALISAYDILPSAFDGATLALSAELGNATVKLAMGNLLSLPFSTLSTFPQLDRHITLSVAWTFFD